VKVRHKYLTSSPKKASTTNVSQAGYKKSAFSPTEPHAIYPPQKAQRRRQRAASSKYVLEPLSKTSSSLLTGECRIRTTKVAAVGTLHCFVVVASFAFTSIVHVCNVMKIDIENCEATHLRLSSMYIYIFF
jgi:hypothetical protein